MRATPGRTGVTYEEVIAAAEAIRIDGGRPTLRRVRDSLGTGSLGTIQKHLATWQEGRQDTEAPRVSLSPELHSLLVSEIGRNVVAARAEAVLELTEVKAARDDLAEELERQGGELETAVATHAGTIVQLRADAALSMQRIEALNRDLARAGLRLEQLEPLQATITLIQEKVKAEHKLRLAAELKVVQLENSAAQQRAGSHQLEATIAELQKSKKEAAKAADVRLATADKRAADAVKHSQRLVEQLLQKQNRSEK
jgi:colicin import membrane protein